MGPHKLEYYIPTKQKVITKNRLEFYVLKFDLEVITKINWHLIKSRQHEEIDYFNKNFLG